MEIIDFKNDVASLTKAELGSALNLSDGEIRKVKKASLINAFLSQHGDDLSKKRMYKNFSERFALHPSKVQELLNITSTERKRWTKEGKLKVNHYNSFEKWGKVNEYPMYDVLEIAKISSDNIESWRKEHQKKVKENRKQAIKISRETAKRNRQKQLQFYEQEWKSTLRDWYKINGELGATLQLAFWTVWISRWAKEFQLKAFSARTKQEEYNSKKERFYDLKNDAMEILCQSPYTTLSFYNPPLPHKITNLYFCSKHYNLWCQLRDYGYIGKWEFFESYSKDITKCNDCSYDQEDDYYSLYYLLIKYEDSNEKYQFSFHIPYPIGKSFLPPKEKLTEVYHQEQEGIFRFGRTLIDEEKVIFKEREVLRRFEEAQAKFKFYFK